MKKNQVEKHTEIFEKNGLLYLYGFVSTSKLESVARDTFMFEQILDEDDLYVLYNIEWNHPFDYFVIETDE